MFVTGRRRFFGYKTSVNIESIRGYSVIKETDSDVLVRLDIILSGVRALVRSGKKTI
jgi:hypothetical protein